MMAGLLPGAAFWFECRDSLLSSAVRFEHAGNSVMSGLFASSSCATFLLKLGPLTKNDGNLVFLGLLALIHLKIF